MGKPARYYTGKMDIVCMGNIDGKKDEDSSPRTEEEGFYSHTHAGRGGDAGRQSEISWHQQERIDRANCSQSTLLSTREAVTGKMLRQLIGEYREQVAIKKNEIQHLEARIQEFEALEKELEGETEEGL
jgi:hypothetical protein